MSSPPTLDDLRRYAVARTLVAPGDLRGAIERLGFVQADPIRAPARAQDLTLRHRVTGYRAGDLEAQYPTLDVEEDTFINYWGGSSNATTHIVVAKYAPLTASGLHVVVRRLRIAAPQLYGGIESALTRVKKRLAHARIDGVDWYWPAAENVGAIGDAIDNRVRLLAPFDPIAWDRGRFERLFGWSYRFEAYTPPAKRTLGYYALPLLWVDRVIGWANATIESGRPRIDPGYVAGRAPASRAFRRELDAEADRMRVFLQL